MDKTISIPQRNADSLFDGADTVALETIDQDASADRFNEILAERIEAAYPDARIVAERDPFGNGYWADGFGDLPENESVSEDAQRAAEELFNDGNLWMVDAGPAPHHPYAARFPRVVEVSTAHELFAWTETHPIIEWSEWPVDGYQNTGDPNEAAFILAVPTPAGLVGFFAPTEADADKIRASVF